MSSTVQFIKSIKKDTQGGLLAYVMIIFLVISIFSVSILSVFNNNLKMAKSQEHRMEAYYLAYSGVELAYAALLDNHSAKLKELTRPTNPVSEHIQNNVSLGNGTINLIAKVTQDTGFEDWIKITATATVSSTNARYVRALYFDPNNPKSVVWIDQ